MAETSQANVRPLKIILISIAAVCIGVALFYGFRLGMWLNAKRNTDHMYALLDAYPDSIKQFGKIAADPIDTSCYSSDQGILVTGPVTCYSSQSYALQLTQKSDLVTANKVINTTRDFFKDHGYKGNLVDAARNDIGKIYGGSDSSNPDTVTLHNWWYNSDCRFSYDQNADSTTVNLKISCHVVTHVKIYDHQE